MLRWTLFTPAVLVTANRIVGTSFTAENANIREEISSQKVSAIATVNTTDVCFEVQKSESYSSRRGSLLDKLRRGDRKCFQLEGQSYSLTSIVDGDLVKLRLSNSRVTSTVENDGSHVECTVEVLKVGTEVSRQTKTIQRVTANYAGSELDGALTVVATDVDTSSGALACFNIKSEHGYMAVPPASDKEEGKLHAGEPICIHFDDEDSTTLATIRTFVVGDEVTIVLASEKVEIGWKNGIGGKTMETAWDFKFDLQRNMQENEKISEETVTAVTFESVEELSSSHGNYAKRYCFKKVTPETVDDQIVCFLNFVQPLATQVKLVTLKKGEQTRLGWRTCKVSFTNDQTTLTDENQMTNIGTFE